MKDLEEAACPRSVHLDTPLGLLLLSPDCPQRALWGVLCAMVLPQRLRRAQSQTHPNSQDDKLSYSIIRLICPSGRKRQRLGWAGTGLRAQRRAAQWRPGCWCKKQVWSQHRVRRQAIWWLQCSPIPASSSLPSSQFRLLCGASTSSL